MYSTIGHVCNSLVYLSFFTFMLGEIFGFLVQVEGREKTATFRLLCSNCGEGVKPHEWRLQGRSCAFTFTLHTVVLRTALILDNHMFRDPIERLAIVEVHLLRFLRLPIVPDLNRQFIWLERYSRLLLTISDADTCSVCALYLCDVCLSIGRFSHGPCIERYKPIVVLLADGLRGGGCFYWRVVHHHYI